MNERIKELAIDWADQLDWDFPSDPKEYTFSSIALEKFATLIVLECINTLEFHGFDDAVPYIKWMATNKLGVE